MLGGVFLCVTGAEALYADMGHFGPKPIRLSWSFVVFPALILNYAGQAAIVLAGAPTEGNIFYRLCPAPLLTPLIVLATVATVIASQSIITGAYSMTRQAIQLGWLPRMTIKQTSEEGYGQIYVGAVNWLLMIVTLGLTIGFGKSDNLAAAYGIAVSATMLMTSVLLFIAMREIWDWPVWAAGAVAACSSSSTALFRRQHGQGDAGRLGPAAARLDRLWRDVDLAPRRDRRCSAGRVGADAAFAICSSNCSPGKVARVPGSAVFFTRAKDQTPPVLAWHVRHNRALHEYVLALTMTVLSVPRVDHEERLTLEREGDHFWRAEAKLGFMERPDVPEILAECKAKGVGDRPRRRDLLCRPRDHRSAPRTARACRAGRRLCSPRWAATPRA